MTIFKGLSTIKKETVVIVLCLGFLNSCQDLSQPTHEGFAFTNSEKLRIPTNYPNFFESYTLKDKSFGTETEVMFKGDQRIMTTNGLPNHKTGDFPNAGNPNRISAQQLSYTFPLTPVFTGKARWAREPGVAVNGIKFEPETAETFICEDGERYRVEAVQDLVDIGLDFNYAHVQPTGAYHYHGVPSGLVEQLDRGEDMILIGFAHDGFPMYYSKSGAYTSSYRLKSETRTGEACSYRSPRTSMQKSFMDTKPDGTFVSDWEYEEGKGDLDECNGIRIDGEYRYFVTLEYPYVGRCLMGEFEESHPKRGTHRHPRRGRNHPHPH
jgi:hypothetical protein